MKKRIVAIILATVFTASILTGCTKKTDSKEEITKDALIDADFQKLSDEETAKIIEEQSVKVRPRTIVTTDGEVDDFNTFIRSLLYTNEVDLQGIIYTSSKWHWAGDASQKGGHYWHGDKWVDVMIDAYAQVYDNLSSNDSNYPTPDALHAMVRVGNIGATGEMDTDTAGSDLIKEKLLDSDERELYLQCWGGTNTIARALQSIQAEYDQSAEWSDIYTRVSEKAVLMIIQDQDDTYQEYIAKNWPDIRVIYNVNQFETLAYTWKSTVPQSMQSYLQSDYMTEQIQNNHGALLELYNLAGDKKKNLTYLSKTAYGDKEHADWGADPRMDFSKVDGTTMSRYQLSQGDFISEGDTPIFLMLYDNGLRSLEDYTYGGWGGRYEVSSDSTTKWSDKSPAYGTPGEVTDYNPETKQQDSSYPLTRWIKDIQEDFAARASWCTSSYTGANHAPLSGVAEGLNITAGAGEVVKLRGVASDPDGDDINARWWQYGEAGSYQGTIISGTAEGSNIAIRIPEEAVSGETIHLIYETEDSAEHSMKSYKRVIITIK